MYLVDTHQHLWDLERFPYSWTSDVPALDRSFLLDEYRREADGCDIAKTIFMECDVDEPYALDEARYAQQLADADPLIAGIVACGRPENAGFEKHLESLQSLTNVKGVRRVLHTQPDELSRGSRFRANLERIAAAGLTFDLCVLARQLPVAVELVEASPSVSFVLDHCGVPDVKGGALEPWKANIQALARCPNVVACKVSGLVAYADSDNWTVDTLRPWFDHVVSCFGWDRLVWGGDWPVCTLSARLKEWVDATRRLTESCTESEQARLFHLNAERIYRV